MSKNETNATHLDGGVAAAVEDLPRLHPRDRDRHLEKGLEALARSLARYLWWAGGVCGFAPRLRGRPGLFVEEEKRDAAEGWTGATWR